MTVSPETGSPAVRGAWPGAVVGRWVAARHVPAVRPAWPVGGRPVVVERKLRLRRGGDVRRARGKGRAWADGPLVARVIRNDTEPPQNRYAVVAGKKAGKAFQRNRLKRLVRETIRHHHPRLAPGHDIVVIVRGTVEEMPGLAEAERAFGRIVRRAGLLVDGPAGGDDRPRPPRAAPGGGVAGTRPPHRAGEIGPDPSAPDTSSDASGPSPPEAASGVSRPDAPTDPSPPDAPVDPSRSDAGVKADGSRTRGRAAGDVLVEGPVAARPEGPIASWEAGEALRPGPGAGVSR